MKGINLNIKNKIIKDIGRSMGGAGKYIRTTNISKGGVCRMKFLATRHTVQQSLIIIIQKETIPGTIYVWSSKTTERNETRLD